MATLIKDKMMRGGTNIRRIISNHLSNTMPASIDVMRTQNAELDEKTLPYPVKYDTTDPRETTKYPFVGAFVTGADRFMRTDVENSGALELMPTYETTIFVTACTALLGQDDAEVPMYEKPYRDSALRQRDDLVSVVLECILDSPSLGTAGSKHHALVDEDSIRVSYPEPIQGNSASVWICSGLITVNIQLVETTVSPYFGQADDLNAILNKVNLKEKFSV